MRAFFGGTGLDIRIGDGDLGKEELECIISNGNKKTKVVLYIQDEVERKDSFAESGFHIQAYPIGQGLHNSVKINVYLSKERWKKLITEYDREAGGGFFCSRCMYDRFHIHYWSQERFRENR